MSVTRVKDASGRWLTDLEGIKAHAVGFFHSLLSDDQTFSDDEFIEGLLHYIPGLVSNQANQMLLRPIELAEIRAVVFSLDPNSAQGPVGFSRLFYRHCGMLSPMTSSVWFKTLWLVSHFLGF